MAGQSSLLCVTVGSVSANRMAIAAHHPASLAWAHALDRGTISSIRRGSAPVPKTIHVSLCTMFGNNPPARASHIPTFKPLAEV